MTLDSLKGIKEGSTVNKFDLISSNISPFCFLLILETFTAKKWRRSNMTQDSFDIISTESITVTHDWDKELFKIYKKE